MTRPRYPPAFRAFAVGTAMTLFCHNLAQAFTVAPRTAVSPHVMSFPHPRQASARHSANTEDPPSKQFLNNDDDDDDDDELTDEALLKQTPTAQLVDLCEQFGLTTKGTKKTLLLRLREYAAEQAELERQRLEGRRTRVEEGGDERERFEIVDDAIDVDEDEDDDDGVFFYYPSVAKEDETGANTTTTSTVEGASSTKSSDDHSFSNTDASADPISSQGVLTAPPPPSIEPDENGERVVTVYSTTDQNDLTGVAAAQPGQAAMSDPLTSNLADPVDAPWDTNNPQKNTKDSASLSEMEAAKEKVSELVQTLLAMSGAPGFQGDGDDDLGSLGVVRRRTAFDAPEGFVGFDPAQVPTEMLIEASRALRTGRGSVLQEVLREFELRGVGHDGAFGDNMNRGGGHYRQVSKVRSFLEGYRRAEVRRLARETATMLLDKLVSEGIEGLDVVMASMTRSSDETSDEVGEFNDSLLDYLNDIIRQQEKKVEQLVDSVKKVTELESSIRASGDTESADKDAIERLWTVDSEDGQRVETFDPQDPQTQKALKDEYQRALEQAPLQPMIPKSAPEKLLLLLKLLRERVKTEAAFSHDEKSRNLRILAYCLKMPSDSQRKELITREFGSSLDRMDSFAELVASSIEYGQSTSHQLQPSKQGSLNVGLLKRIETLTKETRDLQSWRASGAKSNKPMS